MARYASVEEIALARAFRGACDTEYGKDHPDGDQATKKAH